MLCADLLPPMVYTGAFSQLASYSGAGYAGSSGVAKLEVSATGITSRVQFMGPTASVGSQLTFGAHLHAAPCSSDGGGHYQDPANPGVVTAISENWPEVQCDSGGMCGGSLELHQGYRRLMRQRRKHRRVLHQLYHRLEIHQLYRRLMHQRRKH
jgi:hypothetical protein